VSATPHPDDLAGVQRWFDVSRACSGGRLCRRRRHVCEDMIAFGTFENFITSRDRVEEAQWRNVWGVTSGFHFRERTSARIVSADRLTAIGMGALPRRIPRRQYPYDRPAYPRSRCRARQSATDWSPITPHVVVADVRPGPMESADRG